MFSKVLVPLDGSTLAEQALGPAAAIARAAHATLDLVLVHDPLTFGGFTEAPWEADASRAEQAYLDSIARDLQSGSGVTSTGSVVTGSPVERIADRVNEARADLVVMTSHGRTGLSRAWLGSVANGLMRRVTVPVLMIRPVDGKASRARHLGKRILVTLDGSSLAAEILPAAAALARCNNAVIVLLRVVQPVPLMVVDAGLPIDYGAFMTNDLATNALVDSAKQQLAAIAATLVEQGIAKVETEVVIAERVAQAILDFSQGLRADVIAMSTHGRGVSRWFLGSVADKVLRASEVPLLLKRPLAVPAEPPLLDAESVASQLPALSGR